MWGVTKHLAFKPQVVRHFGELRSAYKQGLWASQRSRRKLLHLCQSREGSSRCERGQVKQERHGGPQRPCRFRGPRHTASTNPSRPLSRGPHQCSWERWEGGLESRLSDPSVPGLTRVWRWSSSAGRSPAAYSHSRRGTRRSSVIPGE